MWSPPPPVCWPAVELARRLLGEAPDGFSPARQRWARWPTTSATPAVVNFQPMNVNFGIIPPLGYKVKGKRNKNAALSQRALDALEAATHTKQIESEKSTHEDNH